MQSSPTGRTRPDRNRQGASPGSTAPVLVYDATRERVAYYVEGTDGTILGGPYWFRGDALAAMTRLCKTRRVEL